jgi:hypothetical protein
MDEIGINLKDIVILKFPGKGTLGLLVTPKGISKEVQDMMDSFDKVRLSKEMPEVLIGLSGLAIAQTLHFAGVKTICITLN